MSTNARGLKARGGFEVDISWKDGKLASAAIRASESKPLKVRYAGKEIPIQAQAGKSYILGPDLRSTAR